MADDEQRGLRKRLAGFLLGESTELVDSSEYALMEAEVHDARVVKRDLDLLAWSALDYMGGNEQDMQAVERRKLVQQSRVAWQRDPQIGASTELMNDFSLGRGVPKPKARDPKVQQVLDEAWDDQDNELVLTSFSSQLQLSTDLTLQCNVFILVFDDGEDGKIKLAMLDHDTVENVVRDKNNRRRVLWYVARTKRFTWDFTEDKAAVETERDQLPGQEKVLYYQHWENDPGDQKPAAKKIGKGRVYHVAVNRTGEMAFGHPSMHRLLRWATAFNSLMEARVDMARAAAALIMKRKVKGTPNQVKRLAEQVLSRRSQLGRSVESLEGEGTELQGPRSGSIVTENEGVEHESFNLDSGASNANLDAQMLRSQISSGSPGRWPQHYLGDVGSSNLATASAMELVPMKAVETRQEVLEGIYRWFCDLVIDQAVEKGRLTKELDDAEYAEKVKGQEQEGTSEAPPKPTTREDTQPTNAVQENGVPAPEGLELGGPEADAEAAAEKEAEARQRDLSYDFSLPSPIRKMLSDLVTAVQSIASTFDPNNTNLELSRTLLAVVLGEGLEMADPGEVVEKVFPPGYTDPAMASLQNLPPAGRQPPIPPEGGTVEEPKPTDPEGNPYMLPHNGSNSSPYGSLGEALADLLEQRGRDGRTLQESLVERLSPEARKRLKQHMEAADAEFETATEPIRELTGGDS